MTRRVNPEVKDDITLISTAFPNPAEKTAVIEAYLRIRTRHGDIVEDAP